MRPSIISTLVLAVSFGILAGCANPSVITLNDGREIQTLDRPDYDDESGFYEYEQIDGKPGKVNKDQVRTVREL
ncbi:YgdI/YgdR family lipoprotein [Pseudomonas stutzeri]|uniref:YgdI/YgdR family lipoprotein n=1 Tax=Stutzerimonas stutzeri TaxID=316 RepID=A0A2N8S7T3_STUST|nr:YgdI/YgdR family lipoprotein [Stutzerimonas stutzeri]MCQ4295007.1 YgdI/YgdR family lipoprotein [Stutzerimonas stutzeri]PNF82685.1 YgdI/YgdR family lipoprotein [Stutzerimonas stutzeri]